MDFVDDKVANLLDLGVASSIDFEHVQAISGSDLGASGTGITRFATGTLFAAQSFGEDARSRGFSGPARAAKKIGRAGEWLPRTLRRVRTTAS